MVIIISNPTPVEQEHTHINSLFDAGTPLFHLRKPDYSLKDLKVLIDKIDKQHHSKIALHYHHELAVDYNITRFHYPEAQRHERNKKLSNMTCSTSIHDTKTYASLTADFDYCFLSPLFKSISKHTNRSLLSSDFKFPKKHTTKLIALGGICEATIEKVKAYPFDGIAVLGTIWDVPEKALANYKKINQQWNN